MKLTELAILVEDAKAEYLQDKGYEANTLIISRDDYESIEFDVPMFPCESEEIMLCGLNVGIDNHKDSGNIYLYRHKELEPQWKSMATSYSPHNPIGGNDG